MRGQAAITDFGLCRRLGGSAAQCFTICGSPAYVSPEMLMGQGYGLCTDWYALGVLLHEMLLGMPPFYSHDRTTMWHAIKHTPIPAQSVADLTAEVSATHTGSA